MDAAAIARLSALWDALEAIPAEARRDWWLALEASAPDDAQRLRRMLESDAGDDAADARSLLTGHAAPPDFSALGPDHGPGAATHQPGTVVGAYRLVSLLGRGGLGEVWKAERIDGALKRTVALKLPLWAQWSAVQRWRFERERDILASLDHANIARLYDAGVTPEGQAHLVLELVDGIPLNQWAKEHALSLEQRVALLRKVAGAVNYAHTRLVLHRDLKPANILVRPDGEPMVLDFGIGKLLQPDGDAADPSNAVGDTDALTRLAPAGLTPEYAAPEQILQEPVSTATDVYALGVLLFELLTGNRPTARLAPSEVLRHTLDGDDWRRASARIEPGWSTTMGLQEAQLRRRLRGDLDTILGKALRQDPSERYPTVQSLLDDLERWGAGQPVLAVPPRWSYRASRFLRRHRWGLAAATVAVGGLVVGATLAVLQAQETAREAAVAKATESFLVDLLTTTSPHTPEISGGRGAMTVKELLDQGIAKLNADQTLTIDTRIRLLDTLREMLLELGDMQPAFQLQQTLTELRLQKVPRLSVAHAQDLISLAGTGNLSVPRAQSDAWRAEAEGILDALGDTQSLARGHVLLAKTMRVMFNRSECVRAVDSALAVYRKHSPTRELTEALLMRGNCLTDIARPRDALQALDEGISRAEQMNDPSKLRVMLGMRGRARAELDEVDTALADTRESLRRSQVLRAADELPSNTELLALQQLGEAQMAAGQSAQALADITAVLSRIEARPEEARRKGLQGVMARLYAYQARLAEASDQWPLAIAAAQRAKTSLNAVQAVNVQTRAWDVVLSTQIAQGAYAEARQSLQTALPLFEKAGIDQTVQGRPVLRSRIRLAVQAGDLDEAWRLWRQLRGLIPSTQDESKRPLLRTAAEHGLLELEILAAQGQWAEVGRAADRLLQQMLPPGTAHPTPGLARAVADARVWQAAASDRR